MKTLQLIDTGNLTPLTQHPDGPSSRWPARWEVANDFPVPNPGDGLKYVVSNNVKPDHDPATERVEFTTTIDHHGWVKTTITGLDQLKGVELRKANEEFRELINQGIKIGALTLAAHEHDRAAFSQQLVLIREAADLGVAPATAKITDLHGHVHEMPILHLRQLLVAYGATFSVLWADVASKKEAIRNATTEAELQAI